MRNILLRIHLLFCLVCIPCVQTVYGEENNTDNSKILYKKKDGNNTMSITTQKKETYTKQELEELIQFNKQLISKLKPVVGTKGEKRSNLLRKAFTILPFKSFENLSEMPFEQLIDKTTGDITDDDIKKSIPMMTDANKLIDKIIESESWQAYEVTKNYSTETIAQFIELTSLVATPVLMKFTISLVGEIMESAMDKAIPNIKEFKKRTSDTKVIEQETTEKTEKYDPAKQNKIDKANKNAQIKKEAFVYHLSKIEENSSTNKRTRSFKIEKIIVDKKQTELQLLVSPDFSKGWFYVPGNTYLLDTNTGDKYLIRKLLGQKKSNLPLEKAIYSPITKELVTDIPLTLIFPPLPEGIESFKLITEFKAGTDVPLEAKPLYFTIYGLDETIESKPNKKIYQPQNVNYTE